MTKLGNSEFFTFFQQSFCREFPGSERIFQEATDGLRFGHRGSSMEWHRGCKHKTGINEQWRNTRAAWIQIKSQYEKEWSIVMVLRHTELWDIMYYAVSEMNFSLPRPWPEESSATCRPLLRPWHKMFSSNPSLSAHGESVPCWS